MRASLLRQEDWPLVAIQLFLGHTQTGTTERYIHPEMSIGMLRPLMEKKDEAFVSNPR
jgi:integrase